MEKKCNIILHSTTSCNFNCSYCDVIKDKKSLSDEQIKQIIDFIKNHYKNINRFKFFGGEPLLAWKNIKNIIDSSKELLGNKFEIVTNTSLLNEEVCYYFEKYFEIIFFSIDSENFFDYEKIFTLINKYNLQEKVFFNLIISPGKEEFAYNQFEKIYNFGYKNFNILPVYFTKKWDKKDLIFLGNSMKKILDKSLFDKKISLYGFQNNSGYNSSLINESIFIDTDLNVYYSDFVSTYFGEKIKKKLFLGTIKENSLFPLKYEKCRDELISFEKDLISKIKGQKQLHTMMDYFSEYLNVKKGISKD